MTRNWLTEEERSFGWFVLLVCLGFVTLWVPQMVNAIILYYMSLYTFILNIIIDRLHIKNII